MTDFGRRSRLVLFGSLLLVMLLNQHDEVRAAQLQAAWADASTNINGFALERSTGTTGTFAQITTTAGTVTSYSDSSLTGGTTYCYRVRAFNSAGYSAYSSTACATPPQTFALAVVEAGTGTGTVTSTPAGITCGTSCSANYPSGTAVTVTATAAAGSSFTSWTGGGCAGTGTCTMTLTASTIVTAAFSASTQTVVLRVAKAGTGRGQVVSAPAGITCGRSCSATYAGGTAVTLTAQAGNKSRFTGWSGGGCGGTGACTVTLTAPASVTATFTR